MVVMYSTNIEEPKTYLKCDNICKPMHTFPQLTKFKMFFIRFFIILIHKVMNINMPVLYAVYRGANTYKLLIVISCNWELDGTA